jgi:O-antigen/teichoic acid export membrane protein
MKTINMKIASGIAWMSLMRIGVKGLGLISSIVLARLLVPADFGLVAMAMSVILALELLREFSFDVALIQRQDADRSYYDTAWTLNVLLGLLLATLLVLAAFPAADYYNEPRLRSVMQVLAVGMLISGFENIGVVAFRKDLAFHKEFVLRVAQKACAIAVTLPLAFVLRSYWALVIGTVSSYALGVGISYYAHPFRPRFSLAARKHLFAFSKWLAANNALWFLRDRSQDFVLGRVGGPAALGLFTISYEISNLPTTELVAPINRAVFPGYAKMAHDLSILAQGFLNVIGLVVVVALPAGFGIAATSPVLVPVVLGDKWLEAVPIVSVLAIFGSLNALQTNCCAIHYAMGRPRTLTLIGVIQLASLLPSVIWSAYSYGPLGVAWAYLINVALVIVPLNYGVALHRLRLPAHRLAALLWRPALATSAMYAIVHVWIEHAARPSVITLIAAVALGGLVYTGTLVLLWLAAGRPDGVEKTFTNKFLLAAWSRIAPARHTR